MMKLLIGLAFALLPLTYAALSILQLYAGVVGLSYMLGGFLAVIIVIASLIYKVSLPITVGSFVGMYLVWEWPWIIALLITAPSVLLMFPAFVALLVTSFKRSFVKTSRYRPKQSPADDGVIEGQSERID